MSQNDLAERLTTIAVEKLLEHFAQIKRCVALLSDQQLWFRPNQASNSVANLLLHLRGNVGQWIVEGLGGRPFPRDRPAEFTARDRRPRSQLLPPLEETLDQAAAILGRLDADALARSYTIQRYQISGVAVVCHVLEHLAFHTGQIVTTAKWLLDVDLSLYDEHGHRRNGRSSGTP